MKQLFGLSLAVLLTIPAVAATKRSAPTFATGNPATIERPAGEPGRFARRLAQLRNRVSANVVTAAHASDILVFPAAGSVRGAAGEFFRSDVTLVSFDDSGNQLVAAVWLQNGVSTDNPPEVVITLEPNKYYTFTDFVGQVLGLEGQLGTIVIVPIGADGNADFTAAIDGFSRIWTNQPNATGTVAQPFEAVDPYAFAPYPTASIMGLRHESGFRSNFGIVNLDEVPHNFQIHFLGERGSNRQSVTIPAFGMIHRAVPAGDYGALVIEVEVEDADAFWTTYGTTNDNTTGDGWVSVGSLILTPADLTGQ